MAAYRRVYDSRHLQADCEEPGSAPEPTLRSVIEHGLPSLFTQRQTSSEFYPQDGGENKLA